MFIFIERIIHRNRFQNISMKHEPDFGSTEPSVKSLGQNFLGPVSGPIEIIRTAVSGIRRDNCSFSDRLPPTDDFPPLFVPELEKCARVCETRICFETVPRRLLESWGKGREEFVKLWKNGGTNFRERVFVNSILEGSRSGWLMIFSERWLIKRVEEN